MERFRMRNQRVNRLLSHKLVYIVTNMSSVIAQMKDKIRSLQDDFLCFLKGPVRNDAPDFAKKRPEVFRVLLLLLIGVAFIVGVSNLLSIEIPDLNVIASVATVVGLYIFIPILAMLVAWGLPSFSDTSANNFVYFELIQPASSTYCSLPPSTPYTPPRSRNTV